MAESLYVEKAKVFDLVNGNLAFLDTVATLMAVAIDKFESIKSITATHEPFTNDLYWLNEESEATAIDGTSAYDIAVEFLSNAELFLSEIYVLKTDVRKMRYTDTTDYNQVYQRALAISYEFFKHYRDSVHAMVMGFLSHDTTFVPYAHTLHTFTAGTNVSAVSDGIRVKIANAIAGAADAGTLTSSGAAVTTIAANPSTTGDGKNRATNVFNMNKQQIRTYKRIVELISENWSTSSIALTRTLAKFAASDLASDSMGIGDGASHFASLLKLISSLQASGEELVYKLEEYIDIAKDENGDPLYSDSDMISNVTSYVSHFDASNDASDLIQGIYKVANEFIEGAYPTAQQPDDLINDWSAGTKFA